MKKLNFSLVLPVVLLPSYYKHLNPWILQNRKVVRYVITKIVPQLRRCLFSLTTICDKLLWRLESSLLYNK